MKSFKIFAVCVLAVALTSCGGAKKSPVQLPQVQIDSVSEALGVYFANMLTSDDFGDLNIAKLTATLKKNLNEGKKLERDEFQEIMTTIQSYLMSRQQKVAEYNLEAGEKFLEENAAKADVQSTESGLQYQIIEEGTGVNPGPKDTVVVNYTGTLIDGTQFDSSYDRNEALTIPLSAVVPGWKEGMQLCKEGGKIKLWIPAELGYGQRGAGTAVGPNSVIIFDCELLEVKPFAASAEEE